MNGGLEDKSKPGEGGSEMAALVSLLAEEKWSAAWVGEGDVSSADG